MLVYHEQGNLLISVFTSYIMESALHFRGCSILPEHNWNRCRWNCSYFGDDQGDIIAWHCIVHQIEELCKARKTIQTIVQTSKLGQQVYSSGVEENSRPVSIKSTDTEGLNTENLSLTLTDFCRSTCMYEIKQSMISCIAK